MKAKIDEHIVREIHRLEDQKDQMASMVYFIRLYRKEIERKKEMLVALLDVESDESL